MVRRSDEVLVESKRVMARWRVTSVAKYARWRDPKAQLAMVLRELGELTCRRQLPRFRLSNRKHLR